MKRGGRRWWGATNRFIISAGDENKHILIHIPRAPSMEKCNVLLFTLHWERWSCLNSPPSGWFRTKGSMSSQNNVGLIRIQMELSCAAVIYKNRNPKVNLG